jgi:hypothetical protein
MVTGSLARVNKFKKNGRKETLDGSLGTVGFTFLGKHDLSCTSVMNKLKKNFSIVVNRRLNSAYVDWKTFLSRLNIAGPKPG